MSGPAPAPVASSSSTRHAITAVEKQRSQLERLLKDPSKPVFIPAPPQEKAIRAPRDMMKNVQGSSAGAGSGEFHVYKASRRREYERLKAMEDAATKEHIDAEFERKRKEIEDAVEAKTAKNRAKRQKKKERQKHKPDEAVRQGDDSAVPLKKRRLVNGEEIVFRRPGDASDDEEDSQEPSVQVPPQPVQVEEQPRAPVLDEPKVTIIDED